MFLLQRLHEKIYAVAPTFIMFSKLLFTFMSPNLFISAYVETFFFHRENRAVWREYAD